MLEHGNLRLTNARAYDPETGWLNESTILIVDGQIADPSGEIGEVPTIDIGGRVVIPGMIDAHFHAYGSSLNMVALEMGQRSYLALKAVPRLGDALRRGFTTVRDVAGGDIGLRDAIAEGLLAAPRYLYTGKALSQTGGHGDARPGDWEMCACSGHMCEVVDGVDALRTAVRERFRGGAHAIKMMTSGGVVSPTDPLRIPQYSAEEVAAVCDEARRRGGYVVAHAYSPEAIVHSVRGGVRSIEHGNLLDAESAAEMARAGAYLVPTLVTYDAMDRRGADLGLPPVSRAKNKEVLEHGMHAVGLALTNQVPVGFGTDLMGDLADEQLHGLRLMVDACGVEQTLRSVTAVNADLLQCPDLGRLAPGCVGDLVVLESDPVTSASTLWEGRRAVIQNGRVVCDEGVLG